MSAHGKDVKKARTAYEIWELKQIIAIEKAKELAGWTETLNRKLIIQAGLLGQPDSGLEGKNPLMATVHIPQKMLKDTDKLEAAWRANQDAISATADEILRARAVTEGYVNQFSSMWSQALLNQWNEGQNFFDNMVRGFKQMLAAMLAELIAKAAIFSIFNLLTGGVFGAAKTTTSWATETFPGVGSSLTTGGQEAGGTTVVFNNPVMNQRQIEQTIIPQIRRAEKKWH